METTQHAGNAGDSHDLQRFVSAQQSDYALALTELRSGQKRSHWMWYIFPQFAGLGSSPTSQRYAIKTAAEARDYLRHPLLGARLVEAFEAVLAVEGRSAFDIFGSPDESKLRSSATLFAALSPAGSVYEQVLEKYYDGERDVTTLELLNSSHTRSVEGP